MPLGHKGVICVANGITIETNGLIGGAKELTVQVVFLTTDDVNNLAALSIVLMLKIKLATAHTGHSNWKLAVQVSELVRQASE